MNDTSPEFEAMVNERYRRMTPDERVRIAASMYAGVIAGICLLRPDRWRILWARARSLPCLVVSPDLIGRRINAIEAFACAHPV